MVYGFGACVALVIAMALTANQDAARRGLRYPTTKEGGSKEAVSVEGIHSIAEPPAVQGSGLARGAKGASRQTEPRLSVDAASSAALPPRIVSYEPLAPKPANGTTLQSASRRGLGLLRISNGTGSDAAVLLVPLGDETDVSAIYVRAGARAEISKIAPREYNLRFMLGKTWDGEDFGEDSQFNEFARPVVFEEQESETAHREVRSVKAIYCGNRLKIVTRERRRIRCFNPVNTRPPQDFQTWSVRE